MLRRFISLIVWFGLMASVGVVLCPSRVVAQAKPEKQTKPEKAAKQPKQVQVTSDQVAETVIYLSGTREGLAQVRRSGVERGRITRIVTEGKPEESTYERRFIRGENVEKDRVRIDQKMPTAEYALVFSGGQVWGVINEAVFTPRQETAQEFLSKQWHGIDTLLRYKENGSTLNYIGKEKQKGLDLYVLDVTDKEQRRTRFYISARTARVLWLEYQQAPLAGGENAKFERRFHDYHLTQGTQVPYRTVLYKDGAQVEETQILTITFGPKIDDALFLNPNAPTSTAASTP